MAERPEGAHVCGAYKECAYWAFKEYISPDKKERKWLCSNCNRLYQLDGWTPRDMTPEEIIHDKYEKAVLERFPRCFGKPSRKDPTSYWVVLKDGKRVSMQNGKEIWKAKNHASSAVRNTLTGGPHILSYDENRAINYQSSKWREELEKQWIKEHIEVITLDEWKERGCP